MFVADLVRSLANICRIGKLYSSRYTYLRTLDVRMFEGLEISQRGALGVA